MNHFKKNNCLTIFSLASITACSYSSPNRLGMIPSNVSVLSSTPTLLSGVNRLNGDLHRSDPDTFDRSREQALQKAEQVFKNSQETFRNGYSRTSTGQGINGTPYQNPSKVKIIFKSSIQDFKDDPNRLRDLLRLVYLHKIELTKEGLKKILEKL